MKDMAMHEKKKKENAMKVLKREPSERIYSDHSFMVDGNETLCHHTGYEVLMDDGIWWLEYEDPNGDIHYGN